MRLPLKLLLLNSSGVSNAAPVISAGDFSGTVPNLTASVSDAEAVAYSLGSLAADETVTWTIEAGNAAGKFAINSSTSEITLAETLNWWNLTTMFDTDQYALTIRATDSGGAFSEVTLTVTVTSPYQNGIQFLKLNETSGTDALDYSTVNPGAGTRDAVYNGVTLNQSTNPAGEPMPLADGINDFVNLYSAALNTAFNNAAGTLAIWLLPFDSGFWAGLTVRYIANIGSDVGSNRILIAKFSSANQLIFLYRAKTITHTYSALTLTSLIMTWDLAAGASGGEFKAYVNGVQVGSTQTAIGSWSGALSASLCTLFASDTASGSPGKQYQTNGRLYNVALPAAHIAKLAAEFDA